MNPEIGIEGYNIFRTDRLSRVGGGVCIYMRNDLTVTNELSYSNDMVEIILLKVEELKGLVIGVYRPPNTVNEKWCDALERLKNGILKIQNDSDKYMNIWSFGDYNFPDIDWLSGNYQGQVQMWSEFCDEFFLQVVNSEATRKDK